MKKIALLLLLIGAALSLYGCQGAKSSDPISDTQFKFNTVMTITLYDYTDKSIFKDIWAEFDKMENSFSTEIATSDVSKFNQSSSTVPMTMPRDIVNMLSRALPFSKRSGGNFDPTIEPVVKLWGITTDHPRKPSQAELDAALKHVNYQNLVLDTAKGTLAKTDPQTSIDLGAVAKGYAADKIAAFLKERGVKRAIINLGGNIVVMGDKAEHTPWTIGIQNPFDTSGGIIGSVKVSNKSVVTSGVYERFFELNGVRYHHILSPHDGYPYNNEIMGVSIISNQSVDGDILSTTTFSLGLKGGQNLINELDGVAAIFITKDKSIYFAGDKNLIQSFKLTADGFTIKE